MPITPQGGPAGSQGSTLINGVAVQCVVLLDSSGNEVAAGGVVSVATSGAQPVSSSANPLQLFRDSVVTSQVSSSVTTPGAGATIATVTPGTAGLWEVSVTASVLGVTVAATDSNNMKLFQTAASVITLALTVPGTSGAPFQSVYPPVILNLLNTDTVNVKATALATTGAIYAATLVCRRVG